MHTVYEKADPILAFLWESIRNASFRYHPEGSVLILANSLEQARALAKDHVPGDSEVFRDPPTATFTLIDDVEPRVFVFPDAGCC